MSSCRESLIHKLTKSANEDFYGLHKALGLACLVSILYRFSSYSVDSDMDFDSSWGTPATILLHVALQLSSFFFVIPKQRIKTGYRIWPEARLHALVFSFRSLTFMMCSWLESRKLIERTSTLDLVIVLATSICADLATGSIEEKFRSSTIRDLEAPEGAKCFFSIVQFHGTTINLVGYNRYAIQYATVALVQVNAFLMTLQRRNVASHFVMVILYAIAITSAFIFATFEIVCLKYFFLVSTIANFASILRIGFGLDKYILWLLVASGLRFVEERTSHDLFGFDVRMTSLVSFVAATFLIAWKSRGNRPRN